MSNGQVKNTESDQWADIHSRCVECGEFILETIPNHQIHCHVKRVRCCECLERHFRAQMREAQP